MFKLIVIKRGCISCVHIKPLLNSAASKRYVNRSNLKPFSCLRTLGCSVGSVKYPITREFSI